MQALLAGASNVWFPRSLSALSLPHEASELDTLVAEHWPQLDRIPSLDGLRTIRAFGSFDSGPLAALAPYDDETLWRAIEQRRQEAQRETPVEEPLRVPEWRALANPGSHRPSQNFQLREVPPPEGFPGIESVVLAERLREVRALLGFTRLKSPDDFDESQAELEDRLAPLARGQTRWVPATEVRGEGIFLKFSEGAIQRWYRSIPLIRRAQTFREAHDRWYNQRGLPHPESTFPAMRYILLHSFAHALMRELALECGYSSSSIEERIYAREPHDEHGPMAGILLYTSAPDSEGTLGGLVSLGEPTRLGRFVRAALDRARSCPSDPLCAEHDPVEPGISIHGAACHACLFAPETACERSNRYLDRAVLAPTFATNPDPTGQKLEFF